MGSGSKKAPSYAAAAAISPAIEAAPSSEVLLADEVAQSVEAIEAGAYGHDPEGYEKFKGDVLHAASLLEQASDTASPLFGSATEEELASLNAGLSTAARHHLDDHLAEDLQGIALAEGFHHPAVFTKAGDDSPLAAWLHPLYSQETKGEIQQAALKRFFELADKGALRQAEREALAGQIGKRMPPSWSATPLYAELASSRGLSHAQTLQTDQLLSWLRGKATPEEKEVIAEIALDRANRQEKLLACAQTLQTAIDSPAGSIHDAYHALSTAHQALAEARKNVVWGPAQSVPGVLGAVSDEQVTSSFETFAKTQSLQSLRDRK